MNRKHLPIYAVALAVLLVGALAAGVSFSTLAVGLFLLICPLMMLFMHGDQHSGHSGHGAGHEPADPGARADGAHDYHGGARR